MGRYRLLFAPGVKHDLEKFLSKIQPKEKLRVQAILDSIEDDPRHCLGRSHDLKGDRKGQWAVSLTGRVRLIYIINDGRLIVTAVELSKNHYSKK